MLMESDMVTLAGGGNAEDDSEKVIIVILITDLLSFWTTLLRVF